MINIKIKTPMQRLSIILDQLERISKLEVLPRITQKHQSKQRDRSQETTNWSYFRTEKIG